MSDHSGAKQACRMLRRHPNEAEVSDCMAHRCEKHAVVEDLLDQSGIGGSECAVCVAQASVDALVHEVITPILLAFEQAAGRLALLGARTDPKLAPLVAILEALGSKAEDQDFTVVAQRIIRTAPTSGKVN